MKKTAFFTGMGALAALTGCTCQKNQQPNVVFFFADDIGKEQISHVITYGTMAAKSAIKDVAVRWCRS